MSTQLHCRYTLEEYFALELASEERYEYHDGEAFDLSGDASFAHVQITSNIIFRTARRRPRSWLPRLRR